MKERARGVFAPGPLCYTVSAVLIRAVLSYPSGVYQMGLVYARSWLNMGMSSSIVIP